MKSLTMSDCIRSAIPDASSDLCDHIIWSRTPYPFAKLSAKELYKAASGYQRASASGIILCDMCDRIALKDLWCCERCDRILSSGEGK